MSSGKHIDCSYCEKEKLSKDEIGLNKKVIHPHLERMMCIVCMASYFETTEEELREKIEHFKRHGCVLFG